jgi:hypothetical protein
MNWFKSQGDQCTTIEQNYGTVKTSNLRVHITNGKCIWTLAALLLVRIHFEQRPQNRTSIEKLIYWKGPPISFIHWINELLFSSRKENWPQLSQFKEKHLIKSADSVFLGCTILLRGYGAHAANKCAIINYFFLLWLIFLMKAIVLETEILPLSTGPPNNLQYGQSWQSFIFFPNQFSQCCRCVARKYWFPGILNTWWRTLKNEDIVADRKFLILSIKWCNHDKPVFYKTLYIYD